MLGTEPGEVFGKRPTKRADKRDMCTPFAPICASTACGLNAELAAAGMLSPKFCVWSHICDGMPLSCDRGVQERRQIAMQLRTRPFPIVHDGGLELLPGSDLARPCLETSMLSTNSAHLRQVTNASFKSSDAPLRRTTRRSLDPSDSHATLGKASEPFNSFDQRRHVAH